MQPTDRPRLKVCCIERVEDARLAVRYGASALGLVSAMPSGPGIIAEERIAEIVAAVPPGVATFLLTSRCEVDAIVAQQRRTGANTLQLCDRVAAGSHAELRAELPGVKLVQVVHVADESAVDEAVAVAEHVDGILLDSGNRSLPVMELGGTGRTHDWTISRRICETVAVPVFLAGGLRPDNVAEAIRAVRPFAVDVCSGLRTAGRLDEAKLARLVAAMAAA